MRTFARAKTIRKNLQFSVSIDAQQATDAFSQSCHSNQTAPTPLIDLTNATINSQPPSDEPVFSPTLLKPSKVTEVEQARDAWSAYRTAQLRSGIKAFEEVALDWLALRRLERGALEDDEQPVPRLAQRTFDRSETLRASDFQRRCTTSTSTREKDCVTFELDPPPLFHDSDTSFEDLWAREHSQPNPFDDVSDFEDSWSPISSSSEDSDSLDFDSDEEPDLWTPPPSSKHLPPPSSTCSDFDDDWQGYTPDDVDVDAFFREMRPRDPDADSPCCVRVNLDDLPSFEDMFYAPEEEFSG